MTLRHLKIFLTVADCGKMGKAADKLYISQPSVSQAIAELETHYNVKLFERLSRKLYITKSGELLLSYARYIIDSFDNMEAALLDMSEKPQIRIGGSVTVGTTILKGLIDQLEQRNPRVEVQVTIDNTSVIESKVCGSTLDLAIVEGMVVSRDVVQIPISRDELVLAVGKGHPFWEKESVRMEELEQQVFVSREQGSADRNQFEQLLHDAGISLNRKWSCTNTEAIKNIVTDGKGIAILSKMLTEKEVKDGSLKMIRIEGQRILRQNKLIYHKNKFISDVMAAFIDICNTSFG